MVLEMYCVVQLLSQHCFCDIFYLFRKLPHIRVLVIPHLSSSAPSVHWFLILFYPWLTGSQILLWDPQGVLRITTRSPVWERTRSPLAECGDGREAACGVAIPQAHGIVWVQASLFHLVQFLLLDCSPAPCSQSDWLLLVLSSSPLLWSAY